MGEEYGDIGEELYSEDIGEDDVFDEGGRGDSTYEHYRFVADPNQGMMRVDRFVVEHVAHTSRTKVQEAADAGNILINGQAVKSSMRVKPGDVITVMMSYPRREEEIVPENIPLNIVYEDDDVIVVNKVAGMCVHPGFGNMTGTLVNALAWHLRGLPMFADKADMRPGLVHRIDKDTSGLLVVAKTEMAKMDLAEQFYKKTTERSYIALVWGTPDPKEGTIVGNIGRSVRDRKVMDVFPEDSGIGKHAVTHYEVVEQIGYVSMVRCRLETGRTHQIRAHFKHIGHPLFADSHYGGDVVLRGQNNGQYRQFVGNLIRDFNRQALHAQTLGFRHPRTGEFMRFNSELASDMQECIDRWRTFALSL